MINEFNPIQFGARVKRLRTTKKLSILKLAEIANVNKNTISNIERGDNNTTIEVACKIAKALDTDLPTLFDPQPVENVDYQVISLDSIEEYGIQTEEGSPPISYGVRKDRVNVADLQTHRLMDLNIGLQGGNIIAGILEVYSKGEKRLSSHDGEELFFCLTGKILVNINGKGVELSKGDCVLFWGSDPHSYLSVREDNNEKVSVGLSVIADSKCESFVALHKKVQSEIR